MMLGKFKLIKDLSELERLSSSENDYNRVDQSVTYFNSGAEKVTKAFVSGFNGFYLKICEDFDLFCEFFTLDPTDPSALQKFYQFKQLAKIINQFSLQELISMISWGWKRDSK
ncbi:hypothetical protein G7B40_011140 [Aetokthonos hydrillicola Thurmond2011]|jgi:Leucine-rich repeat (LRR) protein|uniref:Uncharacterized protein n=1 Tax=Aetokthonos hydrillicola Thurmond2011 TaxID=2712845 RepID=A0AAP5M4S4_9CYAN|nr:hypothetical protein [Aetokthonos hydrillicola]MBO3459782.1 hypothetical protein [Aetokthonos hydrillicola CCALA 1050]MBW4584573.1 hypothetical protein [Aetokthonos hydrillicola CCALA 1050]MDR9895116.1 hypothetical protein [Aetokthonos hydrillicola Thurmond2011]